MAVKVEYDLEGQRVNPKQIRETRTHEMINTRTWIKAHRNGTQLHDLSALSDGRGQEYRRGHGESARRVDGCEGEPDDRR